MVAQIVRKSNAAVYAGELGSIYILEKYRGRGVGRTLVQSLAKSMMEHNFDSMLVWALAKNPYRRFYETLGGEYVCSRQIQIRSSNFEEAAYGWRDITSLLSSLSNATGFGSP